MAKTMLELFTAARRVSVPILMIRTADQSATVDALRFELQRSGSFPLVQYDSARGLMPVVSPDMSLDKAGESALLSTFAKTIASMPIASREEKLKAIADETIGFVDAVTSLSKLPKGAVVFAFNAHRQLMSSDPIATAASVQAIANLRDSFKLNFRMLVLLGPYFVVPPELEHDIVVIDHALPTRVELKTIVDEIYASAKLSKPNAETSEKIVSTVTGLSAFAAENVLAMSMTPNGVDTDAAWESKRVVLEMTKGFKVYRGRERFSDVIGLDSIKARLQMRMRSKKPIGVVFFIDEVDKVLANVEHDSSGVRMDQYKTLLAEMEDNEWEGVLIAGQPGGGKSLLAKAFGNEAGVPTVFFDLGAMEGSLVGESEARVRHAISVIKQIGDGNAFMIATSNNSTVMRPELQRRFTAGFYYVDLLTAEQRELTWQYYEKRYALPAQPRPNDNGWSGAEIRNCAREAANSDVTLIEAAQFVLPVSEARADDVDKSRQYAHGRFLDANKPGKYVYEAEPMAKQVRGIALTPEAIASIATMKES